MYFPNETSRSTEAGGIRIDEVVLTNLASNQSNQIIGLRPIISYNTSMSTEDCRYYKRAISMLEKKPKLDKVTCDNPNCNLILGYRKRYFSRDPKDGIPHPIQGWSHCGDIETRLEKIEKMLRKRGQFSVKGEMREKKIRERGKLEQEASELGVF